MAEKHGDSFAQGTQSAPAKEVNKDMKQAGLKDTPKPKSK